MRILLIAPKHNLLDQIPEIRQLTSLHRTTVLNGNISVQDIFDEVRDYEYDVVHFATDLISEETNDEMYISDTESLTLVDTENILKLAKAKLVFFNFCNSARFATYMTNHGIDAAIYTTIKIHDRLAWRFPIAFYEQLKRKEMEKLFSFLEVYNSSAPSDGTYGWVAGSAYYDKFYTIIKDALKELEAKIDLLSKLVSEHALLLGTANLTKKINNKYIIVALLIFFSLIVASSGITIYQTIW